MKSAEKYLRSAYEKMKDPEVAIHLVKVLSTVGQHQEAYTILDDMIVKHPDNELLLKAQADLDALVSLH